MHDSTEADIDRAVSAAAAASLEWGSSAADLRAAALRGLAAALETNREALALLADRETGLGLVRLGGELARTTFQLRGFADLVCRGTPYSVLDDSERAGAPPLGHPHLWRVRVPLGPVAMFSASNFPFAFSVLGGDTASALAAGCPVVVKVHPSHPGLSAELGQLAAAAVRGCGLPAGVFATVVGDQPGVDALRDPRIKAAGFTGSTAGGRFLFDIAA